MACHWDLPCPCVEVRNESRYDVLLDPGVLVCDFEAAYRPCNPEESILYGIVAEQLETFLAMQYHGIDAPAADEEAFPLDRDMDEEVFP
jgi:hypothetical protein